MKKMNKSEIEALASRIDDDVENIHINKQKALDEKNVNKYNKKAKKLFTEISKLSPELTEYIAKQHYNTKEFKGITVEQIAKSIKETVTVSRTHYNGKYRKNHIIDALIIAQIDSDNLTDIIKSVTAQFTK